MCLQGTTAADPMILGWGLLPPFVPLEPLNAVAEKEDSFSSSTYFIFF
jgi:hypothetical protein